MQITFIHLLRHTLPALALGVAMAVEAKPKKELFIPMDYSTCGYHASETAIPNVPNMIYVEAQEGDCSPLLQQAIDYIQTLKPGKNGHRGAILLSEGTFRLLSPLRINTSGVVIRGMGSKATILKKEGAERGAAIYIEGNHAVTASDTLALASVKVMAGATSLPVAAHHTLKQGDRITIVRPSTTAWITHLNCHDYGGGLDYTGWKKTDIDIHWTRVVTSVGNGQIGIDAPITTTIDPAYGGGYILKSSNTAEISECGVENLSITSTYNPANDRDEDHCWDGISINNARDCWVRRVAFTHLAGSAVTLQKHTSRITVEDCIAQAPVSEIGGWRRSVFITRGQQTLVQRCVSRNGIHDFAADYCAAGPNAFVQCEGEESLGFSGSIGSWAAGLLFDIVNIDGNAISFKNLEQFRFGTGWNTANSMMWQCTGAVLNCYSPDTDNRNSAHGCWGMLNGNGEWTSSNDHVQPRSLFYHQLEQRMGKQRALNGYILPRNTNASSSPTIEQAEEMARQSLTTPRLTLEMWIDSVPYTASTSTKGVKNILSIKQKRVTKDTPSQSVHYTVENGCITANGCLVTGNRYQIPWWSGRVKDNFVEKSAKPAITRFVPGREGTGWTDRIDSVVSYLKDNGYCMLDHHYGLWYDLRRTDHERVRRSDSEVWAPFYEQPFARSGKGTAWDGLSTYDLNTVNQWYWLRLNQFASKGAQQGILLFNQHYFQHNILEAGAHWVDCPWRPVNNVNGTSFPEPVPFTGDKRIFIAEQFYNETDSTLRPLHQQYIRTCLEQLQEHENVVHLISDEYTGPLHFTRFWLETIAQWEQQTGKHPLIALSCTKDAQDAILQDARLAQLIDIIDIRYWHYNTDSLWAPPAGKNLAPRQFMRKMKVGKTGFEEAYRAVKEYRTKYPAKAVTFFAQQYPQYGWAILMAGGSMPNVTVESSEFLQAVCSMKPMDLCADANTCKALGNEKTGYVIYPTSTGKMALKIASGKYQIHTINTDNGKVTPWKGIEKVNQELVIPHAKRGEVYWLKAL